MSNKDNQIEEMAKDIGIVAYVKECSKVVVAEHLYNAGYRKIEQDQVIVKQKVLEMFQADSEKFRDKAKFYYEKCKAYGIELFYDPELEYKED